MTRKERKGKRKRKSRNCDSGQGHFRQKRGICITLKDILTFCSDKKQQNRRWEEEMAASAYGGQPRALFWNNITH